MDLRYDEWLPVSEPLNGIVTAYWQVLGDPPQVPSSAILPDGHVELVFNLGDSVGLSGPAYRGDQPARAVVGPLTSAVRLEYRGPVNTFGIRFHPARGAAFLGKSAVSLAEKILPLPDVSTKLDETLKSLLAANWRAEMESCRAALDRVLIDQLASSPAADPAIAAVVDQLAASEAMPPIAEIARELGLSSRQLQRRFLAAVGLPPKQFVRVSKLWQIASMRPPETWAALAAEHGYADQAHMVREFRAFGVNAPTHFFTGDWYAATELTRLSGPAEGVRIGRNVRSVQDQAGR